MEGMRDASDAEYEGIAPFIMRRTKTVRERILFAKYDDKDFRDRFRMSKEIASAVLAKIRHKIEHRTKWNNALSAETMLLITLRFYATGSFLQIVGDVCGGSAATCSRVIKVVSHNLALLAGEFICFPNTEGLHNIQKEFYMAAKFPRVIAAMDCTHVKIVSPGGDEAELYRNRKGWFSIDVQTLCDRRLLILDIVARWPGSTHDATIFRNSRIRARLESGEFKSGVVLADSGYENNNWVVTPLAQCNLPEEHLYNESQIRTRNCVERSYGVWKRRFPVLSMGIRLDLKRIESIIVATAVLHNICCLNRDQQAPPLAPDIQTLVENTLHVPNNRSTENRCTNNYLRRNLIHTHFTNLL